MVLILLLVLLLLPPVPGVVVVVVSQPTRDRMALLSFYSTVIHSHRLQWNATTPTCQWRGVTCNSAHTAVVALRLTGMGLVGTIPNGTVTLLSNIRVISLRYNLLSGEIPHDLGNLARLRALYLHHNRFQGRIPPGISRLTRLVHLDLSDNDLVGEIPVGVNNLKALTGMFLMNNSLTGEISDINISSLVGFNVSYNRLSGSVPKSLSGFPISSFAGNTDLCGLPLPRCPSPPARPPAPTGRNRRFSTAIIIGIAVGGGLLVLLILILLIYVAPRRRWRSNSTTKTTTIASETAMSPKDETSRGLGDVEGSSKLVFFENSPCSFDLEDLLRASAEVLGKGNFGTSYKALLEDGNTVVVKRLKDVIATEKDFEQHMEVLGRIRHGNIVPLRAYYCSKDEKLLVYDHFDAGSLSSTLHGSHSSNRAALDWNGRLRVALAVARGIFHLHSAKLVHGDVKASNVLLGNKPEAAALSDSGLWDMFGKGEVTGLGCRAADVVGTGRATLESDVYSLGVVLLELLTGKPANQVVMVEEEAFDLPRWVRLVVSEEWTGEVFEAELVRCGGVKAEEEMLQVLQVALACVAVVPEQRPAIADVVRLLEEVDGKPVNADEPSRLTNAG